MFPLCLLCSAQGAQGAHEEPNAAEVAAYAADEASQIALRCQLNAYSNPDAWRRCGRFAFDLLKSLKYDFKELVACYIARRKRTADFQLPWMISWIQLRPICERLFGYKLEMAEWENDLLSELTLISSQANHVLDSTPDYKLVFTRSSTCSTDEPFILEAVLIEVTSLESMFASIYPPHWRYSDGKGASLCVLLVESWFLVYLIGCNPPFPTR